MSTYLSILFLVKRSKISSKGLCPIFMRLTISGKRLEFSIGRSIEPEKWCNESGKLKGRSADVRQVNSYLDLLKSRVFKIQQDLTFDKEALTVQILKDKLFGIDQNKYMLLIIMKEHNDKMEKLIGNEYAKGTVIRYKSCYKHLQNFLKVNFKCDDIEISKINLKFINDFEYYLRTKDDKPCSNNSAVKYIKNLGKIIRICLANEWLEKDPYIGYKSSYHEVHRKFLDEAELKRLETKIFKIDRISVVRDIFVFSCYTGLSFVDIKNLTTGHIGVGIDGKKWIFTSRQKTKILSNIPLLSKAEDILNKYVDHQIISNSKKLLPVTSNQKMNSYLKEIADLCGIKKDLTFHIARHTFATTITLSNGVPIESVSKMLGHKSIKTTQIYAKIMDRKVGADMSNLNILLTRK